MSKKNLALVGASFISNIRTHFYYCQSVMPSYIDAYGLSLRVGGSTILFWLIWLFMPRKNRP
jgi:hypothetical protein